MLTQITTYRYCTNYTFAAPPSLIAAAKWQYWRAATTREHGAAHYGAPHPNRRQ